MVLRSSVSLPPWRVLLLLFAACAICLRAGQEAYQLGPNDQLVVRALHVEEITADPIRVDETGCIRLPLVGQVKVSGLTVGGLARDLENRLGAYVRDPKVSVDLMERKSQPVSILGAVKAPGVYQIQGEKRLLEMLSSAGGIENDAGAFVRVTRTKSMGPIPLTSSRPDSSGEFSVAEIRVSELLEAKDPAHNIWVRANDVITIPRAKLVYVVGEVRKPGGFVVREQESLSVLQALSLAEGTLITAGVRNAKILRRQGNSAQRQEIAVNLKGVLAGKAPDPALLPEDVLFVPTSAAKSGGMRAIEAAIQLGTGVVIWRR